MISVALTLRKVINACPAPGTVYVRLFDLCDPLWQTVSHMCQYDNTNNYSQQCDRPLAKKRKGRRKGKEKGKGKDCKGGAKIPERTG